MAGIEEMMPVSLGTGLYMRIFVNHSKTLHDPDHNWTETTYDGEEGSQVLVVPSHWHKYHDEIMEVTYGRMRFVSDGKETILSAGDPPLIIPRLSAHGLNVFRGEKATVIEKAVPAGDSKPIFFQDLYQNGNPTFAMLLRASFDGDGYIALPGHIKFLDQAFVTIFGFLAKAFVPARPTALKPKGKDGEVIGLSQ